MSDIRRLCIAFAAALSALASCEAMAADSDCYDAKVLAVAVEQIPSEIPECDDCIVMSWPWFIDLKIHRVLDGSISSSTIRAISVQHTYFKPVQREWHLRQNVDGGFNIVPNRDQARDQCKSGSEGMRPYLSPGSDQSLDDLREAGIRRYGRYSDLYQE